MGIQCSYTLECSFHSSYKEYLYKVEKETEEDPSELNKRKNSEGEESEPEESVYEKEVFEIIFTP